MLQKHLRHCNCFINKLIAYKLLKCLFILNQAFDIIQNKYIFITVVWELHNFHAIFSVYPIEDMKLRLLSSWV